MIRILRKGMITKHFIPYLSQAKRGYCSRVPLWEIVNAIIYKFKTGYTRCRPAMVSFALQVSD